MGKLEKKVILIIVEGLSDEAAVGPIMNSFFSSDTVQFHVIHGDITTDKYVSCDNIKSKIKEQVDIVKERYRYKYTDFKRIIHLIDTDGAFIDNDMVLERDIDGIMYYEDHMETSNKIATEARNHRKADVLYKVISTKRIGDIPYKIYFNSCNLEHVLYGKLHDFTDEEKEIMADEFADRYIDDIDGFIEFISSEEIAIQGNYNETWKYIQKDIHSLQRNSNMNLIFVEDED